VGSCGIVATQNGNANYNPAQIQTGYIAVTSATNYTVTPRVNGRGGSISPNSVQTVARGSAVSFILTPNSGYLRVLQVGGSCPIGAWSGNTWTTAAIYNSCNVEFKFFCASCLSSTWRKLFQ
ncbi:hypothetical protein TI04_10020, partial [Achromatium sp. WMS2]